MLHYLITKFSCRNSFSRESCSTYPIKVSISHLASSVVPLYYTLLYSSLTL